MGDRPTISVSGRFYARLRAESERTGETMAAIVERALAGLPAAWFETPTTVDAALAELGMPDDVPGRTGTHE